MITCGKRGTYYAVVGIYYRGIFVSRVECIVSCVSSTRCHLDRNCRSKINKLRREYGVEIRVEKCEEVFSDVLYAKIENVDAEENTTAAELARRLNISYSKARRMLKLLKLLNTVKHA